MNLIKSKILPIAILFLTLTSCSTTIKLASSPPGVNIFINDQLIGKTPLDLKEGNLGKKDDAGGYLIRLEHKEYHQVWFWFPSGMRKLQANINMQPFTRVQNKTISLEKARRHQVDKLSDELLSAHTELLTGEISDLKIEELIKKNGNLGALYYLKSLKSLRDGDTEKAKENLTTAITISSSEPSYISLFQEIGGNIDTIFANSDEGKEK